MIRAYKKDGSDCVLLAKPADLSLLGPGWALTPPPPPPAAPAPVCRVLKDTILLRVKAAGKLGALRQAVASLGEDDRFFWDNSSWFSSDNALVRGGLFAIGCDPEEVLAPDDLAP
jgi:hypothetical protein